MGFLNLFGYSKPEQSTATPGWSARMGWHVVTYCEGSESLSLSIEAMAVGADIVYVPNAPAWERLATPAFRSRSAEILSRLKSVQWHRDLQWSESSSATFTTLAVGSAVPGSLESTQGGQYLESQDMFSPDSPFSAAQAREIWHTAARRFAEAAKGRVTLFESEVIPHSAFQDVVLPALLANPNVTLDFK